MDIFLPFQSTMVSHSSELGHLVMTVLQKQLGNLDHAMLLFKN